MEVKDLQHSQLQIMMSNDLGIIFHTPFSPEGKAIVWKKHPELLNSTQAVMDSSGKIIYHSPGLLSPTEIARFVQNEEQPTETEVIELKTNLKLEKIHPFQQGVALVEKTHNNGQLQFSFINTDGKYLCNRWFDSAAGFVNGRATVEKMGYYNYLDLEGNLVFGFDELSKAYDYHDEIGIVKFIAEGKFRMVNKSGKPLSDPFDYIGPFSEGFCCVQQSRKWNYLDHEHNFLCKSWIVGREAKNFRNGWALLVLNYGKYNYLDTKGKKLWNPDPILRSAGEFNEGFALIHDLHYFNLLKSDGTWFFKKWVPETSGFRDGAASVGDRNGFTFVDHNSKPLNPTRFLEAYPYSNGYALVRLKEGYNFMDRNGKLASKTYFEKATPFKNGRALVTQSGKQNFLTLDMEYLLPDFQSFTCQFTDNSFLTPLKILPQTGAFWHLNWFGERVNT
jgi:hypothetical protein